MKKTMILLMVLSTAFNALAQKKKASAIFQEYLNTVSTHDTKAVAAFYNEDGYIEAPYVAAFGMPSKFQGHDNIESTLNNVIKLAPDFHFTSMRVVLETPTQLIAEYESEATTATGRSLKMLYIGVITFDKKGKIVSHREFLNTVPFVEAMFPNGLKDLIK